MAIEEDILTRAVKTMAEVLAKILFGKTIVHYEVMDETNLTDTDHLYRKTMKLLGEGNINEAENILFEALESKDKKAALIALEFYERLYEYDDAYLAAHGFSRKEIMEGLEDIAALYGLTDLTDQFKD